MKNNNDIKFFIDGFPRSATHFLVFIMTQAFPDVFVEKYKKPDHQALSLYNFKEKYDIAVISVRNPLESIPSYIKLNNLVSEADLDRFDENIVLQLIMHNKLYTNAIIKNIKNLNVFEFNYLINKGNEIPNLIKNKYNLKTNLKEVDLDLCKKYMKENDYLGVVKCLTPDGLHLAKENAKLIKIPVLPNNITSHSTFLENIQNNKKLNKHIEECFMLYNEVLGLMNNGYSI